MDRTIATNAAAAEVKRRAQRPLRSIEEVNDDKSELVAEDSLVRRGLYWGVSAFRVKSTRAIEPVAARLYTLCLAAAAFVLLFSDFQPMGRLGERFLVRDPWLEAVGTVLTYLGAAVAIWARWSLGRNWSSQVSLESRSPAHSLRALCLCSPSRFTAGSCWQSSEPRW